MIAALVVCGCTRAPEPPQNVVLYVVDTLRADSVGAYGNRVVETPEVDRFASRGRLFENAFAQTSWTRPSIASILTGVAPAVHGVERREDSLPRSIASLPELFRARGYRTGCVTTNPNIGSFFGFDRGFDTYIELYERQAAGVVRSQELSTTSDVATRRAIQWLKVVPEPFFLMVLTIDPHAPYTPPKGFDRYGDKSVVVSEAKVIESRRGAAVTEPEKRRIVSLYQGEIAFNDRSFGELLAYLEHKNLVDRTAVVFTSDHGEEFWEHGQRGHGRTLFEESIRVPLVIRHPKKIAAGERASGIAQSIDLAPTLAELAGIEPLEHWSGRSLVDDPPRERDVFLRLRLRENQLDGLRAFPWKVVTDVRNGKNFLFDLGADSAERTNRWPGGKGRELLARLDAAEGSHAALRAAILRGEKRTEVSDADLPENLRQTLEALGYVN